MQAVSNGNIVKVHSFGYDIFNGIMTAVAYRTRCGRLEMLN